MKKLISLLVFGVFAPFATFASETANIVVSHNGQANLNITLDSFESDYYFLYAYGNGTSPIFFEFDISSLKTCEIENAYITFTWCGSFGPAPSPAWAKISKGNFSSPLTGLTENDANFKILTVGDTLASITSGTQDEVYSLDITSYLSSVVKADDFISFAVTGYGVTPAIYSVNNSDAAVQPQLVVKYIQAVPEPASYAAIFGALALGFIAWRKRE